MAENKSKTAAPAAQATTATTAYPKVGDRIRVRYRGNSNGLTTADGVVVGVNNVTIALKRDESDATWWIPWAGIADVVEVK